MARGSADRYGFAGSPPNVGDGNADADGAAVCAASAFMPDTLVTRVSLDFLHQ